MDEFAEVAIDASQVIWIMTANDERCIPEPILNRMNVFEIEAPSLDAARRHRAQPVRSRSAPSMDGASASKPSPRTMCWISWRRLRRATCAGP